jgi:hypothetical protein
LKSGKVLRIDPDVEVYALENVKIKGAKPQPAQVITWNIERVGATSFWQFLPVIQSKLVSLILVLI